MQFKKEEESVLPYKRSVIIEALPAICEKFNWKIETFDKRLGIIISRAGTSALSWGERITIKVKTEGRGKTKIHILSESLQVPGMATFFSLLKDRMNIKNVFKELQKTLEKNNV